MKAIILILILSLQSLFGRAQNPIGKKKSVVHLRKPEFPGGNKAIDKYVENNILYPEKALNAHQEGTVRITFVINNDGRISNVQVRRPVGYGMDEEAIRIVKSMPNWKPARYKGKPVNYVYVLPVKFILQ